MKILQKAKGFLTSPITTFDAEKTTDLREAFKYVLVLLLVLAICSTILTAVISFNVLTVAVTLVSAYVGGIIGIVISGLWLHLWAYILGARKGLEQTLKVVAYGGTPSYLLGWIPIVGIIFGIWSLILEWIGLKRLQEMSGGRAAGAIIIAIIIPLIIITVAIAGIAWIWLTGIQAAP